MATTTTPEWERLWAVLATQDSPTADPVNLLATPDAEVWYDPALACLVRIPTGARRPADDVVDPDNFDPLNPDREP